ncbi:L-threonylcarbamoyladenylate synthase [Vibrio europaeus]|uniref:Threonylcarbamoyl-AMP synthase n=1 Tax=Vibrio europaeus TaxID=300876 RepID=A0A178JB12_9VIBR|nr:L-threonylcarbamoyladenylate synthase [Vibrio europaeus]MDC5704649.1 L-threonylcarbamoyladenylate synthase [Vibrio europaeus]MDC5711563.1 L-threonylcarbamoyladenylate synthase [Vibrio europaeus]MDC5713478.1 L-threonylcarbamoyladenylate synthase [Vibrio europaeus]MDC5719294.1 L-threonylcarbamoyladenylate synthase [Vibrio europaeus]MDC5722906.1 L-threonylcarbamoyladenylate synthase [Vibrio europaeus]
MENFNQALNALMDGEVIAYPTEGVFGVGCDPDNSEAVRNLLELKQRPADKGLILIAASYQQLIPYIDESQLTQEQLVRVKLSWPGPITWIMPSSHRVSQWVSGQHQSIAVRVTDHPLVQKMCNAFGKPLTSTSANLSGQPPCMTSEEVYLQFGYDQIVVLEGQTGGREKPSEIRDAKSLQVLRQG